VSEPVARHVRAAIEDHGPIGFDEYMEIALYGAGGFFETPPVGADEHFVTSPHVHPFVFAHCVRDALLDAWFALGELDPFDGVVVANEVLDNLPFVPIRGRPDGPKEVRVGARGASLGEIEVPWSDAWGPPPRLEPGEETTVPVGAFALLRALARALGRGYVLLIDYGSVEGPAGPVHGYREHREVADVLADPGATDITAGVDVSLIADRARSVGLSAFEPVTQQTALRALGHDRWQQTMQAAQTELQRAGRNSAAVRVWEERSRASLLTDPSRFGGFWWLVLATEGLPEPPWLARARTHAERPKVR
jgi:SAM-dependent MidA family methyltransferase